MPAGCNESTEGTAARFTSTKSLPVCRAIQISRKQNYLWRAIDQESLPHERSECFWYGEVVVFSYRQSWWLADCGVQGP
jgi:hypothetical protein